jgi:DNA polymerase-3 subunit epsilon
VLVLSIDFETTGLDPEIHAICEVGAALWDTDLHRPVKTMGYLIDDPDAVWTAEATAVTGLTAELCQKYGHDPERSLKQLLMMYGKAEAALAHNGNHCDKRFMQAWCSKYGYDMAEKLWIDTMTDIEYPAKWSKQLGYLASHHGFLNPFPHGALTDALTTAVIFDKYDLEKVLEMAKTPTITIQAFVSKADKDKAKELGFHAVYDGTKFIMWAKDIKACYLERERAACSFPVEIVVP